MVKLMFLMIISILFSPTKSSILYLVQILVYHPNLNQIIVTSLGVQKLLESLTLNKASGPDDVPTYILRELNHKHWHPGFTFSKVIRSGSVAK